MEQRRLTLREYQTSLGISLTASELDALRVGHVAISPSVSLDVGYDLTPTSWVGAITTDTLAVEIRPKLPIDRLLFLLSYALDPAKWRDTFFHFKQEASLLEAIIPGFVYHVRRAISRGLLQGYRHEEDALMTVRGRWRIDDQIRDRFGVYPPVEVRYDEYTEDIEENRLLKAAIERLKRLHVRSDAARISLRAFDSVLAPVQLMAYAPRNLPSITFTRLNEHYRPAILLAELILRATSFELHHGHVQVSSFLVDMNKVFENFVVVAIREALYLGEREFPQEAGDRWITLDEAEKVRLRPDISWWRGSRCIFVGDVKYKQLGFESFLHPDLYQLLAYCIALNLPEGLLIYAAGESEPGVHLVRHTGKTLKIVTLDLSGSPDELLSQIKTIAQQIEVSAGTIKGTFVLGTPLL